MAKNVGAGSIPNVFLAGPFSLASGAGAGSLLTLTHAMLRAAEKIEVLDSTTRQPIAPNQSASPIGAFAACTVGTNSTTTITVQNNKTGAQVIMLRVTMKTPSSALGATIGTADARAVIS